MKRRLLILFGLLVFTAAAGFLVLTTGLNLAVESSIVSVGSEATQTPVAVEDVEISLFSGKGEIRGLTIANPDGFDTEHAFTLERVFVHLDIGSLRDDIIVVREITIDGAALIAEQKLVSLTKNNLRIILGSLKTFAETGEPTRWPTNLVIEQFNFTNAQATLHAPLLAEKSYAVPAVHVSDIGRPSVGVSVPEAPLRILEPVIAQVLKVLSRSVLGL